MVIILTETGKSRFSDLEFAQHGSKLEFSNESFPPGNYSFTKELLPLFSLGHLIGILIICSDQLFWHWHLYA